MNYKTFLIGYVEDNELGVYNKEIIIEGKDIQSCFGESIIQYPTLHSIRQVFGGVTEAGRKYYSHESQDQLRKSQLEMGRNVDEMFKREILGEVEDETK